MELEFYANLKKAVQESSLELINCINKQSRIVLEEIRLAETNILKMLKILELGNIVPEYLHKNYKILKHSRISRNHHFDLSKYLEMIQDYYNLYKLKHLTTVKIIPSDIESNYKFQSKKHAGLSSMITNKYRSFEVDHRYFMIGTKIGDIFLYNKNDLKQEKVLLGHNYAINSLVSRGNRLISQSFDDSIIVWSLENFTKLLTLKNVDRICRDLVVGRNYFLCILSQNLCIVRIEDLGVEKISSQNENELCRALAINQDDSFGVAGYYDKVVIWDINKRSVHRVMAIGSENVQFISYDTFLIAEGSKLTISKLFEKDFESIIDTNQVDCRQLTISRDKKYFATRSAIYSLETPDFSTKLWRTEDRSCISVFSAYAYTPISVKFDGNSNDLAILTYYGIKIFKINEIPYKRISPRYFNCISASDSYVVIGNKSGDCSIVNLQTEKQEMYFNLNAVKIEKVITNENWIICSTRSEIVIINVQDPKFNKHTNLNILIHDIAYCKRENVLIIVSTGLLSKLSIEINCIINSLKLDSNPFRVECIGSNASSCTPAMILTASSEVMEFWNFYTLRKYFTRKIRRDVICISINPNNSHFAIGCNDATISTWEVDTVKCSLIVERKTSLNGINSIFIMNQDCLIATSDDFVILISTMSLSNTGIINSQQLYSISSIWVVDDMLITCLIDDSIILWDIKQEKEIKKIIYNTPFTDKSLNFELYGQADGNVYLANLITNKIVSLGSDLKPFHHGAVRKVRLHGNLSITASWNEVKIWNLENMTLIRKIKDNHQLELYSNLYPDINEFQSIFQEKLSIFQQELPLVPEKTSCASF